MFSNDFIVVNSILFTNSLLVPLTSEEEKGKIEIL